MDRDQIVERARQAQRAGGDRAAHRRRTAPQAEARLLHRRRSLDQGDRARDPREGVYGRRDRVLRQDHPSLDRGGLEATDRRRPRQPAWRRGRDLPSRGPRAGLRCQGDDRDRGSTSTGQPIAWACTPTPPCFTAISTSPCIGSTTSSVSASFKMRPADSRRSSRWPSTPTTREMSEIPKPSRYDGPQDDGHQPTDARQFPAHQGLLGHAGAEDRSGRARRSVPTTSTAPSFTRRSTTRQVPRRPRK